MRRRARRPGRRGTLMARRRCSARPVSLWGTTPSQTWRLPPSSLSTTRPSPAWWPLARGRSCWTRLRPQRCAHRPRGRMLGLVGVGVQTRACSGHVLQDAYCTLRDLRAAVETADSPNITLLQVCNIDAAGLAPGLDLVGRRAPAPHSCLLLAAEGSCGPQAPDFLRTRLLPPCHASAARGACVLHAAPIAQLHDRLGGAERWRSPAAVHVPRWRSTSPMPSSQGAQALPSPCTTSIYTSQAHPTRCRPTTGWCRKVSQPTDARAVGLCGLC